MDKIITWDEVKKHKTKDSCWVVINNEVYDVTKFLDEVSPLWELNIVSFLVLVDFKQILCVCYCVYSIQEARKCCWNRPVR